MYPLPTDSVLTRKREVHVQYRYGYRCNFFCHLLHVATLESRALALLKGCSGARGEEQESHPSSEEILPRFRGKRCFIHVRCTLEMNSMDAKAQVYETADWYDVRHILVRSLINTL